MDSVLLEIGLDAGNHPTPETASEDYKPRYITVAIAGEDAITLMSRPKIRRTVARVGIILVRSIKGVLKMVQQTILLTILLTGGHAHHHDGIDYLARRQASLDSIIQETTHKSDLYWEIREWMNIRRPLRVSPEWVWIDPEDCTA